MVDNLLACPKSVSWLKPLKQVGLLMLTRVFAVNLFSVMHLLEEPRCMCCVSVNDGRRSFHQ
jgi:hypothetical protein